MQQCSVQQQHVTTNILEMIYPVKSKQNEKIEKKILCDANHLENQDKIMLKIVTDNI